jgi:hypothetical protein
MTKHRISNTIWAIFSVIFITVVIWFTVSYINILSQNNYAHPHYASWNILATWIYEAAN